MARQVRLFLIRHGETVDNVAQLYAGSRDSVLTNHGYQQATRLGSHFASLGLSFTHFFSSHLQRAAKTAGLIREAQVKRTNGSERNVPDVIQLPCLMEQDFGFYEGKKFYERPADGKLSGKDKNRQAHKDSEGFVNVESKESLARRADAFLDGHLLPLLNSPTEPADLVVAIVSHGIMLSSLWKRILSLLPEKSVKLATELAASGPVTLEHLGGWSNTGFLELRLTRSVPEPLVPATSAVTEKAARKTKLTAPPVDATPRSKACLEPGKNAKVSPEDRPNGCEESVSASNSSGTRKLDSDWATIILTINGKEHLKNLKRTGGGVGSSRHDASQKNIESFFKRRKVD
ncbi:phosphoglycerate mutase-like protein [Karstenula rhodostoma CBS 690.94]|uniref:Phosphoglycerate mutase-like protein n=1 Tax=Karstenula rhodostoma CBS 690.94 TaxID=1392251 RepID=A0A9P4PQ21_9PLEO|nr:phosphoglycerate mutase-like protein [Karstenula rhodostoma CBS 690.94]